MIQIDASSFDQFEISEFEISRFNCTLYKAYFDFAFPCICRAYPSGRHCRKDSYQMGMGSLLLSLHPTKEENKVTGSLPWLHVCNGVLAPLFKQRGIYKGLFTIRKTDVMIQLRIEIHFADIHSGPSRWRNSMNHV